MKINVFELPVIRLPVVNVSTDPLDVMLTGIGLRLKHLSKTNEKFKASLKDKDFIFQIMSENGVARHFHIKHGHITSIQGAAHNPSLSLIFQTSESAVKTLIKGDPTAFMLGMQSGKIKMEGDFALLMWFNSIAKYIPPTIPKPVQQKIKTARALVGDFREKYNI